MKKIQKNNIVVQNFKKSPSQQMMKFGESSLKTDRNNTTELIPLKTSRMDESK